MPNVSETIPIVTGLDLKVGVLGQQSPSGDVTKSINWDGSKVSVVQATLTVKSSNSYATGAELHVMMNDSEVGVLHWQFAEIEEQSQSFDVTNALVQGDNKFSFIYKDAVPVVSGQDAIVSASIQLVASMQSVSSGNPFQTGNTKSTDFWRNLANSIKSNIWLVIGLLIAVAVVLSLVIYLTRGGSIKDLRQLFTNTIGRFR